MSKNSFCYVHRVDPQPPRPLARMAPDIVNSTGYLQGWWLPGELTVKQQILHMDILDFIPGKIPINYQNSLQNDITAYKHWQGNSGSFGENRP